MHAFFLSGISDNSVVRAWGKMADGCVIYSTVQFRVVLHPPCTSLHYRGVRTISQQPAVSWQKLKRQQLNNDCVHHEKQDKLVRILNQRKLDFLKKN